MRLRHSAMIFCSHLRHGSALGLGGWDEVAYPLLCKGIGERGSVEALVVEQADQLRRAVDQIGDEVAFVYGGGRERSRADQAGPGSRRAAPEGVLDRERRGVDLAPVIGRDRTEERLADLLERAVKP